MGLVNSKRTHWEPTNQWQRQPGVNQFWGHLASAREELGKLPSFGCVFLVASQMRMADAPSGDSSRRLVSRHRLQQRRCFHIRGVPKVDMRQWRFKRAPHASAACPFTGMHARQMLVRRHACTLHAGAPQQLLGEERSPWPAWASEPSSTCPTPWLVTVPWRVQPKSRIVYEAGGSRSMFAVAQLGFLTVMAGMHGDVDGGVVQEFIDNILEDVAGKHGALGPDEVGDALWYRCVPLGRLGEAFVPHSRLAKHIARGGSAKVEQEQPDYVAGAGSTALAGVGSTTLAGAGSTALAGAGSTAGLPAPSAAIGSVTGPPAPTGSLPQASACRGQALGRSAPCLKRTWPESSLGEGGGNCMCVANCGRKTCMQRRNKRRSQGGFSGRGFRAQLRGRRKILRALQMRRRPL